MGGAEDDSVEAAAEARRERLRALKAAQELLNKEEEEENDETNNNEEENQQQEEEEDNVNMKFRNYLPHDKQLQEGKLTPPVLPKFEDPVLAAPNTEENKEDPFLNIAPKKPNWDLRRDLQKKLDKLERRTNKAMIILMEQEEEKRRTVEGEDTIGSDGED